MPLLEDRYYNNQEPDELEDVLQEAYEAGINDGYNEALNEGVMDKLKLKILKYKLKNKFNNFRKSDKAKYLAGAIGGIALSHLARKGVDKYNERQWRKEQDKYYRTPEGVNDLQRQKEELEDLIAAAKLKNK